MFIQIVEVAPGDPEAARTRWERCVAALRGVDGWLGATGGIAAEGPLIASCRFTSREHADVHDSAAVWGTGAAIGGTDNVQLQEGRDLDRAGFVQFMRARVSDRAQLERLEAGMADAWAAHRPDYLGGYRAWFGPDDLLAADYFTSEAEARAGEAREPPAALADGFAQWQRLMSDTRWYDLAEPWLASP
jgi:hypothetical protein